MAINHKFYTSDFNSMYNVTKSRYIPIAICKVCPSWYSGLSYDKLDTPDSVKGEFHYFKYAKKYRKKVLDKLNPEEVAEELCRLADEVSDAPIVLVFRDLGSVIPNPRELITEWFNKAGIPCEDLK